MNLNNKILSRIKSHSLKESPNECCGLIIKKAEELDIIECDNASHNKNKHFEISSEDFLKASRLGKIAAYYHSHTEDNPEFSNVDKAISLSHKLPLVMYAIKQDKFSQFNP